MNEFKQDPSFKDFKLKISSLLYHEAHQKGIWFVVLGSLTRNQGLISDLKAWS